MPTGRVVQQHISIAVSNTDLSTTNEQLEAWALQLHVKNQHWCCVSSNPRSTLRSAVPETAALLPFLQAEQRVRKPLRQPLVGQADATSCHGLRVSGDSCRGQTQ